MSANWKSVKEDLEWSLNLGEDVKGREDLKNAFSKEDAKHVGAVVDAFKKGQRDNHKISNISRCAHEDEKRLYNMGRKIIGLKAL
jgi:Flp pilus assembly CpaE family ATPase